MRKIATLFITSFILTAVSAPGFVPPDGPDFSVDLTGTNVPRADNADVQDRLSNSESWKSFAQDNGKWRAVFDEISGIPRNAIGPPIAIGGYHVIDDGNVEEIALKFAEYLSDVTGVNVSDLHLGQAKHLGNKWFVTLDQYYQGVPVYDRRLRLKISDNGKLFYFGSSAIPDIVLGTVPTLSQQTAFDYAVSGIGYNPQTDQAEYKGLWVLAVLEGNHYKGRLCHRFLIDVDTPLGKYETFTDAENGSTLFRYDTIRYETLTGTVTGMIQLETPFDEWVERPFRDLTVYPESYNSVLTDVNGNFTVQVNGSNPVNIEAYLAGAFSRVANQQGADAIFQGQATPGVNFEILWDDNNSNPAERCGYYSHLVGHTEIKIIEPAFTDLDFSMYCKVNLNQTCNAYWDGSSINFFNAGGGCTNTAQIADVVYHEYGHGVTDYQYKPYSPNGAQHEGWSDYFAATITDQPLIGRGFYSNNPNGYLRTCDNTNRWPEDWSGEPHNDGLIIAGALWHLRQDLGDRELADSLFHYARYGYSTNYEDYFYDVLAVDDDDNNLENGTPHAPEIYYNFGNLHGIGPGAYVNFVHTPLVDTEDAGVPIPVVSEVYAIYDLNPDSILCYYNTGSGYQALVMQNASGDTFATQIPGQPSGTTINYYLLGVDISGIRGTDPENAPQTTHTFYVGPDVTPPTLEVVSIPDYTIDLFGPYGPFIINVTDLNDINPDSVYLHFKINDGTERNPIQLQPTGNPNEYTATLTTGEQLATGDAINFYFTATDMANTPNNGRYPASGFLPLVMSDEELVDDFESGTSQWDLGDGWVLDADQSYQGDYSITDSEGNYPNNANNPLTLIDGYNLTPYSHATVNFMYKSVILAGDYVAIEVTNDGGATTEEIGRITGTANWRMAQYAFDQFTGTGNENVQLIFRMVSDASGNSFGIFIDNVQISINPPSSAGDGLLSDVPKSFNLEQNYPNPFNPTTTISYSLDKPGRVILDIINLMGQKVISIDEGNRNPGSHLVVWEGVNADGSKAASGIYFYRLQAGERTAVKRMLLLK